LRLALGGAIRAIGAATGRAGVADARAARGRHGLALGHASQEIDLLGRQVAPASRLEAAQGDGADGDADQAHDLVAELGEHAPDLAVLALGQDQLEDGRRALAAHDAGAAGAGLALGQPHAFDQLVEHLLRGLAGDDRLVHLLHAELRVRQAVGQLAVVGEDHEPDARLVEAADGEHALGDLGQEIDHAGPAGGVGIGRDVALGLADGEVDHPLGPDRLAVEGDFLRLRIDAGAQLADLLAIDRDTALEDQLLAGPPRAEAGVGEHLLEAGAGAGLAGVLTRGARRLRRAGGLLLPGGGALRPGRFRPGSGSGGHSGRPLGSGAGG
jgi:hypothetical protein